MKNIKLTHKLVAAFLCLGIIPTLIITWLALGKSGAALEERAFEQMVSVREMKKAQVKFYFDSIRGQIETYSNNAMIIEAAKDFRTAFNNYTKESGLDDNKVSNVKSSVRGYYTDQYLPEYQSQNKGNTVSVDRLISRLDNTAIGLQHAYISDNAYPLGSKDTLDRAKGEASYHEYHAKYHPKIRHFLHEFGYYDIFIIDPENGNIIYSVFKELDYATSLVNGPYADTNFAEAYQYARRSSDPDTTYLIDFKQYTPSYDAPASFISSPIYDENELVGVLVFQMPIDRLNSIMAERAGLGESGETYLVGEDNKMRSDSYLSPELHSVVASFRNPETGSVDSAATQAALKKKDGEEIIIDYNGNPVLSAYTHVDLGDDIHWALMAEIDEAEAFAAIPSIRNRMLLVVLATAVVILSAAFWFARSITAPFQKIFTGLTQFSNQELNGMGHAFQNIAVDISTATDSISAMSNHISEASTNQAASLEETSASMEEISSVTQQNADHAKQSSELSTAAQSSVIQGNEAMEKMSSVMDRIKSSSEEIAGILKIIDDISFQTNILALNAAVEAARAGESGAGFAVVADEVRQLAQRTANASQDTAKLIQESVGNAQNGVEAGQHLSEILKTIESNVGQAAELAKAVSSASHEQTEGITQINGALTQLDSTTQRNAAESEELAAQSVQLTKVVESLDSIIGLSRTSGGAATTAPTPGSQLTGEWNGNSNTVKSPTTGPDTEDDFDFSNADGAFGEFTAQEPTTVSKN